MVCIFTLSFSGFLPFCINLVTTNWFDKTIALVEMPSFESALLT